MDEYISKESAISIFKAKAEMAVCTPAQSYFYKAAKMIELLPAADVETFQIEGSYPISAYFALGKEVEEQTKKAMITKIGPELEEKGIILWKERVERGNQYVIRAELKVVRP